MHSWQHQMGRLDSTCQVKLQGTGWCCDWFTFDLAHRSLVVFEGGASAMSINSNFHPVWHSVMMEIVSSVGLQLWIDLTGPPKRFCVILIGWKPTNAILLSCGRRYMLSLRNHPCPEMCPKCTFLAFFSHSIFVISYHQLWVIRSATLTY